MVVMCMTFGTLSYNNIPGEISRGVSQLKCISLKNICICIYFYVKNAETENWYN